MAALTAALLVAAVGVGEGVAAARRAGVPQTAFNELVFASDRWVAFTATFEQKSADQLLTGQIAQDSAGSQYRAWFAADGAVTQAMIFDRRAGRAFRNLAGRWTVQPLESDPSPSKLAVDPRRHPPVPAADTRIRPLVTAYPALRFFEQRNPNGVVNIISPDLNMRSVWHEDGRGTLERWVSLDLQEPPASLFSPPSGVELRTLSEPIRIGRGVKSPAAPAR